MVSLLGIIFMLLLTGCVEVDDASEATVIVDVIGEEPLMLEAGGTLHISMRTPQTLNPILNEDITVDTALRLVFEHLFILDETLKPVPNLARDVEFSADGMSAVITLRDDVVWSDGVPMRADDVIFTLDTIRNTPNSIYANVVQGIQSYSMIDSLTIQLNFNTSSRGLGNMFLFPVIPIHYYRGETTLDSDRNMNPLGNGPFIFDSYTLAREMVLSANPSSFRPPHIQTVNVLITSNIETEFHALGNGILTALGANILDFGRYGGTRELNITSIPKYHFDFIGFNFQNTIFDDKVVRQAIAHALPKEELIDMVYLGQAVKANSPINPMSWIYEENTRRHDFDLELARNLIAESNYIQVDDGGNIISNIGEGYEAFSLRILVNEENEERLQIATVLKQNLESIGIEVEFMVYEFSQYMEYIESGNFDLVLAGFNLDLSRDLRFLLHSSQIGYTNFISYSSRIVDMLLTQAINAPTIQVYENILGNLQRYIAEELPIISIAFRTGVLLTDPSIAGDIQPSLNNIFQNIDEWFIVE